MSKRRAGSGFDWPGGSRKSGCVESQRRTVAGFSSQVW